MKNIFLSFLFLAIFSSSSIAAETIVTCKNPGGQYGSKYSNDSPNNPCAMNSPATKNSDGYYDYLKSTNPSVTKDSDGYYDYLRFRIKQAP